MATVVGPQPCTCQHATMRSALSTTCAGEQHNMQEAAWQGGAASQCTRGSIVHWAHHLVTRQWPQCLNASPVVYTSCDSTDTHRAAVEGDSVMPVGVVPGPARA